MNTDNPRVTMIMGAGGVLDMNFPQSIIKPSTWNITNDVIRPYTFTDGTQSSLVHNIYQLLIEKFPVDQNLYWLSSQKPNIHFEIIFHVMELLMAYEGVWSNSNQNPSTYPYFAPFTKQNFEFNKEDLSRIMWLFIDRIMKIVNDYDEYFRNDHGEEDWYRLFFRSDYKWDVFNFNYDTTIEACLGDYEDGFERQTGKDTSIFKPAKLIENKDALSTINHIHGCIKYFYKDNPNDDLFETNLHDLYLYPTYHDVHMRMMGRGQSNPYAQTNEEYFAGPIITGLRKTEKLACMPYDFYHGNLYNSIIHNNAMVIVGYSFGDLYVNNLIKRMHAIWGGKERIVVIDKWDGGSIHGYNNELRNYMQTLSSGEIEFLEIISGCNSIDSMIRDYIDADVYHPKYSKNKCLMLITSGMKDASRIISDVNIFLNS